MAPLTIITLVTLAYLTGRYHAHITAMIERVANMLAPNLPDTSLLPMRPVVGHGRYRGGMYLIHDNGRQVSRYLTAWAVYQLGDNTDAIALNSAVIKTPYQTMTPSGGTYTRTKSIKVWHLPTMTIDPVLDVPVIEPISTPFDIWTDAEVLELTYNQTLDMLY